jgi:hypothetical protein
VQSELREVKVGRLDGIPCPEWVGTAVQHEIQAILKL